MADIKNLADVDSEVNKAYIKGREDLENKILDIMNEFGDDPKECLSIIGEYINLAQHFRKYPNASDPETQNP